MSDEILSLTDMTCPHCGRRTDDATAAGNDPEALPSPGDPTICTHCTGVGIYTEDSIRKATDEELTEFAKHPQFKAAMLTALLSSALIQSFATTEEDPPGIEIEFTHPGHGGDDHPHTHTATVLTVGMDEEGHPRLEDGADLTESMRSMLAEAMYRIKVSQMAQEIGRWVTQEVANHVLSVYGNEEASMPSLTTGALISLIRLCHEADDQMMSNLNDVRDFHGYVLAVAMMAEKGPDGMEMLEQIAGLRPVKKEQDAKA